MRPESAWFPAAAAMYRRFLGWPAYSCGTVVWMRPGVVADAVVLPVTTAERVLAALDEPPPVLVTPGTVTYWTLLTLPRPGHSDRDSMIMLPPSEHPDCTAPLHWRHPPTSPLPSLSVVTDALRNAPGAPLRAVPRRPGPGRAP